MNLKSVVSLVKETFQEWSQDKASRLAAAMAYYTAFALAPLLVLAIAIASLVFEREAVQAQVLSQFQGLIGREAADQVATMIQATDGVSDSAGIVGAGIALVTLLLGASGVFGQLQDALNTMWEVKPDPDRGWRGMIRDRFQSFTLVLGTGFLLLVSLVLGTVLTALGDFAAGVLPGSDELWQVINFLVSFAVVTLLFAAIFKFVPDAEIAWRDVWIGAAATALLFTIGRFLIGLYLGQAAVTSAFGAAGSLVVLLVWLYYSAQILFLGAEFTQVYANRYGSRLRPAPGAVSTGDTSDAGAS